MIGKDLFPTAAKKMHMKKPADIDRKQEQQETNQGEESVY